MLTLDRYNYINMKRGEIDRRAPRTLVPVQSRDAAAGGILRRVGSKDDADIGTCPASTTVQYIAEVRSNREAEQRFP